MGLYTIPCKLCGQAFVWFSGSPDQRCEKCKLEGWEVIPIPAHKRARGGDCADYGIDCAVDILSAEKEMVDPQQDER